MTGAFFKRSIALAIEGGFNFFRNGIMVNGTRPIDFFWFQKRLPFVLLGKGAGVIPNSASRQSV